MKSCFPNFELDQSRFTLYTKLKNQLSISLKPFHSRANWGLGGWSRCIKYFWPWTVNANWRLFGGLPELLPVVHKRNILDLVVLCHLRVKLGWKRIITVAEVAFALSAPFLSCPCSNGQAACQGPHGSFFVTADALMVTADVCSGWRWILPITIANVLRVIIWNVFGIWRAVLRISRAMLAQKTQLWRHCIATSMTPQNATVMSSPLQTSALKPSGVNFDEIVWNSIWIFRYLTRITV